MSLTPAELDKLANDPVLFIEEVLGFRMWDKQQEICESVRDHRKTFVRSCHGSGKTAVAARIVLWWLLTRPYSSVVTTAATAKQVDEILWKEIRKAWANIPFDVGAEIMPRASKIRVDDDWVAVGFSTNDPNAFQGFHSPGGVLTIFEEATGVDAAIWKAAEGIRTNPHDRFLAIGNPTEPTGLFYEAFQRHQGNCIHISAFDLPNVKAKKTIIPGMTGWEWVEEMRHDLGEENPEYVSRVLGEFPDSDDRVLVPLSWLNKAAERWMETDWTADVQLGVDVARMGGDSTIVAVAHRGQGIKEIIIEPKQPLTATAGSVVNYIRTYSPSSVRIDSVGEGSGVYDMLVEQKGDMLIEGIKGGHRASDPDRYFNKRSELYWTLRNRLDPNGDNPLALPDNAKLRSQLSGIRFSFDSKGRIKIESKDEMAKRGMKSPDEADAVVYALAQQEGFDTAGFLAAMGSW